MIERKPVHQEERHAAATLHYIQIDVINSYYWHGSLRRQNPLFKFSRQGEEAQRRNEIFLSLAGSSPLRLCVSLSLARTSVHHGGGELPPSKIRLIRSCRAFVVWSFTLVWALWISYSRLTASWKPSDFTM